MNNYKIKSKVWLYPGLAAWHFVSVPKKEAAQIKKAFGGLAAGFGSLPVNVKVGETSWRTSIFPDSKTQTYLLPLKAQIRKKENIKAGHDILINLEILT